MVLPIFRAASVLSQRVHTEILPHDDSRPERFWDYSTPENREKSNAYQNWLPSDETSAKKNSISSVTDVKVGDLVLVIQNTKYRGEWQWNTIRAEETIADLARRWYGSWAVVTGATAKRISIARLHVPNANWADAADGYRVSDYVETVAPDALSRFIVKTGLTLEEFKARAAEHPDYQRYLANFAAAVQKRDEIDERDRAERKARAAAAKPVEAAAKRASEALGIDGVITTSGYDERRISVSTNSLGGEDKRRLLTLALAGRLALGEITQEQHDEAVSTVAREGMRSA